MKRFHKQFGEVKVTNSDATTTTIVILATGEVKKLLTKYANLTDAKIEPVKKAKEAKTTVTEEYFADGQGLALAIKKSTARYRTGKSGALSL